MYGIGTKLLQKWVSHCSSHFNGKKWRTRKTKLSTAELLRLMADFGFPNERRNLTKAALLERCEMRYDSLRENMRLAFESVGLTKEGYSAMDKFPPRVSMRIVAHMG